MQQQPARKILLRSPRIAQRVFGLDSPGQIVRSVPRAKFMFKVQFVPSAPANNMLLGADLNSINDIRSVAFKVKTIDKPKVNLTTVELNQYNKKKLAYTKVDYNDVQLRIYDTVDNSMLSLWVNYFTYYFGDSRLGKAPDMETYYRQSSVGALYQDGSGWGFRPINENVYFFNSIDVSAFYGQTMTTFRYMNPRIVSIDWQSKDYSSNELEEVTVSFKHEGIVYDKFGEPVSDYATGWTANDTLDYPYGYATAPAVFQPRIFNPQTATYNRPMQTTSTISNPSNIVNGMPLSTSAIAPGATIPNTLLNSQMLQPNNLVSGLAMAMNYIPNGIQGINNIPFATIAALGGIKGIGGVSQLLGDAVGKQLSGVTNFVGGAISSVGGAISGAGNAISNLFNGNQVQNVFTGGIPQSPDYMSGSTSSQAPDITTNGDSGGYPTADPGAVSGQSTSPASDISTSDLGVGTGGQGAPASPGASRQGGYGEAVTPAETPTFIGEENPSVIQGTQSEFIGEENAAVEPPGDPPVNDVPADSGVQLADPSSNSMYWG